MTNTLAYFRQSITIDENELLTLVPGVIVIKHYFLYIDIVLK